MPNKMLIDASHPEETRVVVVRGNRIEEFDFESQDKKQLKGNIYLARVTRVEPSLQAAFVEYGGNRHGFLAFSEIHPDYYQIPVADRQALLRAEAEAAEDEDDEDGDGDERRTAIAAGAGAGAAARPRPRRPTARPQGRRRLRERRRRQRRPERRRRTRRRTRRACESAKTMAADRGGTTPTNTARRDRVESDRRSRRAAPTMASATPPADSESRAMPRSAATSRHLDRRSHRGDVISEPIAEATVDRERSRRRCRGGPLLACATTTRSNRSAPRTRWRKSATAASRCAATTRSRKSSSAGRSCWSRSSRKSAATRARRSPPICRSPAAIRC